MCNVDDASVICRHAFGARPDQLGTIAILMERDRTEQYKGAFDRVDHELKGGVFAGLTGRLAGAAVSAIYSKGPSNIADCVAYLARSETPCRTVVATGSVGGLGRDVGMGDFVLVDSAVGHDGYSRFLARRDGLETAGLFGNIVPATGTALRAVEPLVGAVVQPFGVRAHRGRIFTTPAVSLEDEAFLAAVVEHDCLAIDMETAPFYAACREHGFDSLALHWVTDLPQTRSFFHRFRDPTSAEADWNLKHAVWLNMTKIITTVVRKYIEGCHP